MVRDDRIAHCVERDPQDLVLSSGWNGASDTQTEGGDKGADEYGAGDPPENGAHPLTSGQDTALA